MHYLHKILVYIPDVMEELGAIEKSELANEIRLCAEQRTESYYESVFDWRETETAGRWQNIYPQNVLFALDDIQRFSDELSEILQEQKNHIDYALSALKCTVGTDLEKIIDETWNLKEYSDNSEGFSCMTAYYLSNIASILHADYESDSLFYNSHEYTARLYPSDIEEITKSPGDWALVMFDYHN